MLQRFSCFSLLFKPPCIKIIRKGFKYVGYINVLYGDYKKFIKKVNVFQSTHKVSLWRCPF